MAKRKLTTPKKRPLPRKAKASPVVAGRQIPTLGGPEKALTKPEMISELTKSPHGDLSEYMAIGRQAAIEDPDFFGHLIAWNHAKGAIRDAKVALPVIGLCTAKDPVYLENAAAHLADLAPRDFLRGLDFARKVKAPSKLTRRLVKRYLRDCEAEYSDWERTAIQHRKAMHEMYARFRVKPAPFADSALFKSAARGKFEIVKELKNMDPVTAAGAVIHHKIPFLIAKAALGKKLQDPDVLLAVIKSMSPTELVTNVKSLERWGVRTHPATRSAFEEALKKAATSKKATLKTSKAAEVMAEAGDDQLAGKLQTLQEKQLDNLKGIEGDWLILADKSGSMSNAIELARQVASVLTRLVKGKVHLIFFDTAPRYFEVTGQTLDEIYQATKGITPGGGTNIGCGMRWAMDQKLSVDGIAIVSDGADHGGMTMSFSPNYAAYVKRVGVEPTVYLYDLPGEANSLSREAERHGIDITRFDLRHGKADYYSLPNLVQTMRVGRYSLLDEILAFRLRTLDHVLKNTTGIGVVSAGSQTVSA